MKNSIVQEGDIKMKGGIPFLRLTPYTLQMKSTNKVTSASTEKGGNNEFNKVYNEL